MPPNAKFISVRITSPINDTGNSGYGQNNEIQTTMMREISDLQFHFLKQMHHNSWPSLFGGLDLGLDSQKVALIQFRYTYIT